MINLYLRMKYRISSHIRWIKYLFLAIGIGLLLELTTNTLLSDDANDESTIVMILFLIICGVLYHLFNLAKTIEFDHEFMYISGKNGEEKVALQNIHKIKLTMTKINNRSMWKIGYYDQQKTKKTVRFSPRLYYNHFDEFKNLVKKENNQVTIQNWSHSFDFDQ